MNIIKTLKHVIDDYRPTIPSPWPIFNDGIQGGFGPGDLAIVFGNPGGGKSWTWLLWLLMLLKWAITLTITL